MISKETYQKIYYRARMRKAKIPTCPLCKPHCSLMFIRGSYIQRYPWRDDQQWKCPRCKLVLIFGIPISSKEAKEEHTLRNGYAFDFVGNAPDIKQKLKALGYLEWE